MAVNTIEKTKQESYDIAIVDDDPLIRTILTNIINDSITSDKYKYNIISFQNGSEFLHMKKSELPQSKPCLIILDIVMPNMDGFEVLRNIRSLPNQHQYFIMMLSSIKRKEDIQKAVCYGVDDFLTKPIQEERFKYSLSYLLNKMKY